MQITIKAPKATKVKSVLVAAGAPVKRGDPVLELFDYEERKALSQISRVQTEIQVKIAECIGPDVVKKRELLRQIAAARIAAAQAATAAYNGLQEEYKVGQITIIDVIKGRQDVALRSYQTLQSAIEAEVFERNADDALRVLNLMVDMLKKEQEYVERSADRLRVRAPAAGRFTPYVFAGTPVRLGHVLGEIR